jgi:hypothetical protein
MFMNMKNMCFYEIFFLFYDSKIDYTPRQSTSFDQYPFPIRHPCESYSTISYFFYLNSLEEFHGVEQKLKS